MYFSARVYTMYIVNFAAGFVSERFWSNGLLRLYNCHVTCVNNIVYICLCTHCMKPQESITSGWHRDFGIFPGVPALHPYSRKTNPHSEIKDFLSKISVTPEARDLVKYHLIFKTCPVFSHFPCTVQEMLTNVYHYFRGLCIFWTPSQELIFVKIIKYLCLFNSHFRHSCGDF